jgi:hypothetical protein
MRFRWVSFLALSFSILFLAPSDRAQSSGTIEGVVKDASGAAIPNATVEIHNPVSQFERSTTTDNDGKFRFTSVPFNPYHLTVTATGFAGFAQDVDVRSVVSVNLTANLKVASAETSVTVQGEAGDLIETTRPLTQTSIAICSRRCRWKARRHRSAR